MLSSKFLIMCFGTYPTFFSVTNYYFGVTSRLTMGATDIPRISIRGKYFFTHDGEMFKFKALHTCLLACFSALDTGSLGENMMTEG